MQKKEVTPIVQVQLEHRHLLLEEYFKIGLWYLVFVFLIPMFLFYSHFSLLRYYFSFVDILGNIFANIEHLHMAPLYSFSPTTTISYISTNFLSLLALLGATFIILFYAKRIEKKHIIILGTFMFLFTYLIPVQLTAFWMQNYSHVLGIHRSQLKDLFAGLILLNVLLLFERILIQLYLKFIK